MRRVLNSHKIKVVVKDLGMQPRSRTIFELTVACGARSGKFCIEARSGRSEWQLVGDLVAFATCDDPSPSLLAIKNNLVEIIGDDALRDLEGCLY